MRDSINGLWLFGIVMTLMVFLIAFVAISLNYSRAFRMKSEMVNVIEQYNGINGNTINKLDAITNSYGYRTTKKCGKKEGVTVIGIKDGYVTKNPKDAQEYCIYRTEYTGSCNSAYECDVKYIYNLDVFFSINLPLFGNIFTYTVSGETKQILYPEESYLK